MGGLSVYVRLRAFTNQVGAHMGDVIRFTQKSEIEGARLIREARAIYASIFPPNDAVSQQPDGRPTQGTLPGASGPIPFCKLAVEGE
jgi:hypothetical protein